jgi:hypothetical protein
MGPFSFDLLGEDGMCQFIMDNFKGDIYPEIGMTRYAPTGEPYVTIVSGGEKEEGDAAQMYATAIEATEKYKETLLDIFSKYDDSYVLYFRRLPGLSVNYDDNNLPYAFTVSSRFLISDKPVIEDFEKFLEEKRKCAGATF